MITLEQYWMGHTAARSPEIERNAALTVELVNKLLAIAHVHGVDTPLDPRTGSNLTSGWRPAAYNATVPGAAVRSKHISAQAADLYDPEGDLDDWLIADYHHVMADLGLWLEHPAATKGWCHVQTAPPNSKKRVFYP